MRILIIDDDDQMREVHRDFLEGLGHEIFEASNGAEGLLTLGQHTFDLVISDVAMPLLDGVGFLKIARPRFPKLPIFLITGGSHYTADVLKTLGATAYMEKINLNYEEIFALAKSNP